MNLWQANKFMIMMQIDNNSKPTAQVVRTCQIKNPTNWYKIVIEAAKKDDKKLTVEQNSIRKWSGLLSSSYTQYHHDN